jgi:hypothetical protein
MCSLDFRLVKTGMALYHHTGDILSSPFSPKYAFFFISLMIREGTLVGVFGTLDEAELVAGNKTESVRGKGAIAGNCAAKSGVWVVGD